ncbi:hypothetical protein [uncultured Megasphaera sp.]|uniref:hypothetical protein n=1 Tax=uncultured Megasphaera sp. TaxID=165188 RepID=UPI002592CCF3|nr:hypothetical protein [uncultured Megasphaera sp.]
MKKTTKEELLKLGFKEKENERAIDYIFKADKADKEKGAGRRIIIRKTTVKSSNGGFWYYLPFIAVLVSSFSLGVSVTFWLIKIL